MVTASFFAATQVMHPASHLEARLSSSSNVRSWPIADRFWPIADVEAGELAGSVLVSAFDPKRTFKSFHFRDDVFMSELSITRDGVRARSRVWEMASDDPKAAAETARRIRHPWYRCQALARAAEFSSGPIRYKLLEAAFSAAKEQREPNRIVTVSSWPLRVLADSSSERAAQVARLLVDVAETEPHNLRRAHALQALASAVAGRPALLSLIVPALASAILGGRGPRIDRVIRDTFELVRVSNPELLRPLAHHHKSNRQQERLLATLVGDSSIQRETSASGR